MASDDEEMQPPPDPDATDPSNESTNKENEWTRLVSRDGFTYLVRRKVANISGTIKSSLDSNSGFSEAETHTYIAHEQRGIILEKLLEYMAFKSHYLQSKPKDEIPVNEFMERLPPELVLELLVAADYSEL